MAKEHIVIIDDEPVMCRMLRDVLQEAGYEVITAGSAEEGLGEIEAKTPVLVLSDIRMPKMDGMQLLSRVRTNWPDIPVIIMTGHATLDTAREAIASGASDYLLKPFDLDAVRRSVRTTLDRQRLARENQRLRAILPLFEISQKLTGTVKLEDVVALLLEAVTGRGYADRAECFVLPLEGLTGGQGLVVRPGAAISQLADLLSPGEIDHAIQQFAGVIICRAKQHELQRTLRLVHPVEVAGWIKEVPGECIGIPIRHQQTMMGCLLATKDGDAGGFSESDFEFLSVLVTQAGLALENSRLFANLESTYVNVLQSLVLILEAKSPYTSGHSHRVTRYAQLLARELRLDEREVQNIGYGGSLHDIGKIGCSEEILLKPGALSKEEYEHIKQHPSIGDAMLRPVPLMRHLTPMVRHHHERMDGRGYPDATPGDQLSLEERIMGIVDAYDAMTSDRPYRRNIGKENAIQELRDCSGTQFDPELLEVVLRMYDEGRWKLSGSGEVL